MFDTDKYAGYQGVGEKDQRGRTPTHLAAAHGQVHSWEQFSVLGLVSVAFLNIYITQVNALGALLEVSNKEVRVAYTG